MLTVINLIKSYGLNPVLNGISFTLIRGQRTGLVGANGVGKTTLLKILIGDLAADSGKVYYMPQITTGFLPQIPPNLEGQTIDELIQESFGGLRQLKSRMRRLEKGMETAVGDELVRMMNEYGEASSKFEESSGYEIDYQIERVLKGLRIDYLDKTRTMDTLSGGEQTRVGLAVLLLKSPDLLVLDEPTNNLDWPSLEWLEIYLSNYKGAVIAASHDRQFLNKTVTDIFEIDEHTHGLKRYKGNYEAFRSAREDERLKKDEEYRKQQEEIRELKRLIKTTSHAVTYQKNARDGDKFIPHFKGERVQKQTSHVINNARKRLQRIEENPVVRPPRPMRFRASLGVQSIHSTEVIRAVHLTKSYAEKKLLNDISFSFSRDARIVITGPNGSGKTTLCRILAGVEKADTGGVYYAPSIRIGYLPQTPAIKAADSTILEYYSRGRSGNKNTFVSELLLAGIFRVEDVEKKIGDLSLGQVRRLELARMIVEEPNTLILDEPTNYISLDVLEALETSIANFRGPVLSVSHDRRFIEKMSGEVWELNEGNLMDHVTRREK